MTVNDKGVTGGGAKLPTPGAHPMQFPEGIEIKQGEKMKYLNVPYVATDEKAFVYQRYMLSENMPWGAKDLGNVLHAAGVAPKKDEAGHGDPTKDITAWLNKNGVDTSAEYDDDGRVIRDNTMKAETAEDLLKGLNLIAVGKMFEAITDNVQDGEYLKAKFVKLAPWDSGECIKGNEGAAGSSPSVPAAVAEETEFV